MAKENFVNFKKGQSGNLNSQSIENGTFWLTTDDQRLYIDIDDNRLAINANATTTKDGLMPSEDKSKLNYTNIAYGTCSTAAGTAAKVITVSGNT